MEGKTYFDLRYEEFFTVLSIDKTGEWLHVEYEKRGGQKMPVHSFEYLFEQGQYLEKVF